MLYKLVLCMFRNNLIQNDWRHNTSILLLSIMFCNSSIFQSVTGMHTWDIRHTVVVLHRLLFTYCFFSVNMDVFVCCARVSCMKRLSKNTPLELKEVHFHLLAFFTASLSAQKLILCDTWAVNHSFLFTVIIGIMSKCLILTCGNISIQNHDSLIYKK